MLKRLRAPNFAESKDFLAILAPHGVVTYQTIPERQDIKGTGGGRILHGPFDDVAEQLGNLNLAGHGIFVMINEGDGEGRSAKNVKRVRAHFLDLDGAPVEPVLASALPPHILVESSPGKWHAYWLTEDCPLEMFKVRQHALAEKFNGDPAVCDLPRVMRLPGFWHQKGDPFRTRLVQPAIKPPK